MRSPLKLSSLPVHPHPPLDLREYRLRVDGLVDQPVELSIGDLMELPQQELEDDFTCLEGWVVPQIRWRGVQLATVLGLVAVRPEARWVQATFEEFSLPLPLDRAGSALLALMLDGAPIPVEHGAPVRLLVPDGECFTSIKWLEHLELRSTPAANTAEMIARARLGSGVRDTDRQ